MIRTQRVLLLGVAIGACSDAESVSTERCAAVRDHAVELQLTQAEHHGAALAPEVRLAHALQMRDALGETYIDTCRDRGAAWAACALGAENPAALDRCAQEMQ